MTNNIEVISILNNAQSIDEGVNQVLQYIGETFQVSRVYIFEMSAEKGCVDNTFEWCAPGISAQKDRLINVSLEKYGYDRLFEESDVFICPDSEETDEPMRSELISQDIKAMLQCAIRNVGKFQGFIGVDDCSRKRPDWAHYDKDISELRSVSSLLSLYLIKERNYQKVLHEQEMRKNENKQYQNYMAHAYTALTDQINETLSRARMGLWSIVAGDGETRLYADPVAAELVGIEDSDISPEDAFVFWKNHIDPEPWAEVMSCYARFQAGLNSEVIYPYNHPKRGVITIRCGGSLDPLYFGKGWKVGGYHQDISEYRNNLAESNKNLSAALEKERREREIIESVAKIYDSMHLIDFENNTFRELNAMNVLSEFISGNIENSMQEILWCFMRSALCPAHAGTIIEFTDFSTLEERMKGRISISADALNHAEKWWRFEFIRVGSVEQPLKKVLFVSRNVNETKSAEEALVMMSLTDELTKISNRHAYEKDVSVFNGEKLSPDLRLIAIDLNGLKIANDSMGHDAGDELLIATADCCARAVSGFGKIYRTGGDEFMALVRCTDDELTGIVAAMDSNCRKWKGRYSDSFSFSRGVVSAAEMPGATVHELEKIADRRMYEDKKAYYSGSKNRRIR